jgi:hypothetical protein
MIASRQMMTCAFFLLATGVFSHSAWAGRDEDAELQQAVVAYNANVERPSEEVVCKNEARIGSRIKRPVCRTKSYLKREEYEVQRYIKKPRPSVTRDDAFTF